MISILKNSALLIFILVGVFTVPLVTLAQSDRTQTLSVSPTLFQMSANPSQSWTSEIRVVNVNDYPITVYPQVVNFAPSGETGTGSLIPIFAEETQGKTLAEWVTLSQSEVLILPQQTVTIPFSVTVVDDAAPGGHYAAILVGTKPPARTNEAAQVQTAQFVTALIFVRVSGDVLEAGNIREFTTAKTINSEPNIQFDVRFENTGNVHLQPQGDITITNMWGSQRGVIPINYQTHFGNVLPNSIRKFSFTWTGEQSSYDIGRFKAIATLGYGEDTKNFATSTTYFWVIPLKQIAFVLGGLLLLFWFLSFAIKMYIKRMLTLAGLDPVARQATSSQKYSAYSTHAAVPAKTVIIRRYQTVTGPVRHSMFELVQNLKSAKAISEVIKIIITFLIRNKIFILFMVVIGGLCMVTFWFFGDMNTKSRPYDVSIVNPDATVVISSDEILYRSLPEYELPAGEMQIEKPSFKVELINASGEPGLAAKAKRKLEAYGYDVTTISNELGRSDTKSVIIFNQANQAAALELSKKLNGALLSVDAGISPDLIRVYIGTDNR
ncbi:LytR C-terminal domain-containing protein [Patescibacteria group bacterium]|nr:LytR C-terminal domain-containing protein [Patescibacteria group bacterium]